MGAREEDKSQERRCVLWSKLRLFGDAAFSI
jgi:hypothetical protein